jgi:acetyl esterase/lipase
MGREILELPAPAADHRIPYGPADQHFADLRIPAGPGPHPVAIVLHGGFWRCSFQLLYMGHLCQALRRAGIATWNIEYRGIGHQGGAFPGTLQDVAAGASHLADVAEQYCLDLARVIAAGHSAGGHLALWLATSKRGLPLRGAVSLGGVADLHRAWELQLSNTVVADFMGGSPEQYPERYRAASPIENLPCGIPLRLVHGDADIVVPIAIAERFLAAATEVDDDCRLIRLPGAGHFDVIDPRAREWAHVEQVIRELLRDDSPDPSRVPAPDSFGSPP